MARLERGKGKRQQVIDLSRHGRVLRTRENAGGDLRLPGYRRCGSEAAAQELLAAEVRRLVAEGMRPGDDEARAIADAMPRRDEAPPALPLRRDFGVYNEANGFVVTSRRMAGKTLEEGSEAWRKAVAKGDLLPMSLVQDDPFVIRVVAGEPLSAQEDEEWVARVDWHLNVSDGRLCITGGSVFSTEDYDDGDPYYEGYVAECPIPKGRYRATLYTHVHGVNGGAVMDLLAGGAYGSGEPLDDWWTRTRGGETPPAYDDGTELVGFLLHLEPVDKAPRKGLDELPAGGWFEGGEHVRKPERCPRGLVATEVVRTNRDTDGAKGWTYVRDVREMLGDRRVKALRGGALALRIADLVPLARLAWFGSRWTVFELRLAHPEGLGDLLDRDWPAGAVVVEEGKEWRILFDADVDAFALFDAMVPTLASLPVGSTLQLLSAPAGSMLGEPGDEGRMWTSGTLRDGTWSIVGAWPPVDAATLGAALALARETEATLAASGSVDEEARAAILMRGARDFAERFSTVWAVAPQVGAEDDDDDDDDDDLFPRTPIKGAAIWEAPNGRQYHQTMALLLSEDVASGAQAKDRALVARAIVHVGDLVCDRFENVAVRGYAKTGGTMWGFLLCAAPDTVIVQLATRFADGGVLVTTADPDARDAPERRIFRTGLRGANTRDLLEAHEARAAELAATLGAPLPTERTMLAFAQALDAVVDATA